MPASKREFNTSVRRFRCLTMIDRRASDGGENDSEKLSTLSSVTSIEHWINGVLGQ